jgi:eukaryotic-like serine/threonine-protein kinase
MRANSTDPQMSAYEPPTELQSDGEPEDDERLLGRYQLKKQLGSGAFGTVWLARDERLDRDVAVKSLPRDRVIHQRFEREARAAARLQHPAIVTLYEAAVDDDGAYLVSELVRGKTLDAVLQAGKFSDRDILEIGIALTGALAHAHEQGVIHRDVKPSNILIPNRVGTGSRAKLTDFGVAQVVGAGSLTRSGDVIGTLAYMSPEQADGHEVTESADLYALAVVLYEALTGVNPLYERTLFGRNRHRTPFIPPLRRQRRDLPKTLANGIDRALAERAVERGTLDDLHQALSYSLASVDDTPGIVAPGWNGTETYTEVQDQPGPEWREQQTRRYNGPDRAQTALYGNRGQDRDEDYGDPGTDAADPEPRRLYRRPAVSRESLPEWLPRAASAAAAGVAAALLCTHLLKTTPLAPATFGLLAAAATLLFPRIGSVAVVMAFVGLAITQNRGGDGLLLAAVALPPLLLIWLKGEVLALPALAPLFGLIGLAGAFPAVAGRRSFSWYQRAVLGAAGYIWTLYASALAQQALYWWPLRVSGSSARAAMAGQAAGTPPPLHSWIGSAHAAYHVLIVPLIHSPGLAGAAVWAAAAVLLPLIQTRRWPLLDLILTAIWAIATVMVMETITSNNLHGAVAGAAVGFVIAAWPAASSLMGGLRYGTGESVAALR